MSPHNTSKSTLSHTAQELLFQPCSRHYASDVMDDDSIATMISKLDSLEALVARHLQNHQRRQGRQ